MTDKLFLLMIFNSVNMLDEAYCNYECENYDASIGNFYQVITECEDMIKRIQELKKGLN